MGRSEPPSPAVALAALLAALAAWLCAAALLEAWAPPIPPHEGPAVRPDLNRSPAHHLMLAPGVGPARAARIVAEREARGPFRSVDDLTRVHGIGPTTARRLRGLVTATGPATPTSGREPPDPPAAVPGAGAR